MIETQLPTYQDLVNALCDVLDGIQDHHIQDMTGLPDEDCDKIVSVRSRVIHLWQING